MTLLSAIADRAQVVLGDSAAGTWSQAVVEGWIKEAIRDYSQHFKRTKTVSTVLTSGDTGVHSFDLPGDFRDMVEVEYPADEDPPVYLKRLSRKSARFWARAGFYDVEITADADYDIIGDAFENPATFWISDEVEEGETLRWIYTANHDATISSSAHITVPEEHEHLLVKFVYWQAIAERLATEAQNPDTTIRMLQQFKLASQAAENAYRSALADAKKALSGGGYTGPWKSDIHDPIY
jgi:hypothetical protein